MQLLHARRLAPGGRSAGVAQPGQALLDRLAAVAECSARLIRQRRRLEVAESADDGVLSGDPHECGYGAVAADRGRRRRQQLGNVRVAMSHRPEPGLREVHDHRPVGRHDHVGGVEASVRETGVVQPSDFGP